jgi:hypothetical protein
MLEILGVPSILVTIGVTLVLLAGAAFMTGQALASTWRPLWHAFPYGLLLGFVDRFLIWGLFDGNGLSVTGYLIDTAIIILIEVGAYRITRARKMTGQYPWLYERTGLFSWRERSPDR